MRKQQPESKEETNRKSGFAYAAAFTLFACVVSFTGLGYLADLWFGTPPWCLVGGIVLGSAAGLYEFVKISAKTY
jgi:F0F1-type ATP synthase assembly protein I